ncbi:hypothetical protein [Seonamhaeicola sp.]|uniref:hypothetical protein n=1 Tax=Seonamhaeicola sp. TaxID=1912245 RepID=UPI00260D53A2|nr:hypothetical protein [Seonamhaeicola sp.]
MPIKKREHQKIENRFKEIFNTTVEGPTEDCLTNHINGVYTVVKEPLVRQQIIQLARLCEEVPLNTTLKASGGNIVVEFW